MKVTNSIFQPITPKSGLIGFIQFVLDGVLTITGVGVYRRKYVTGDKLPHRLTFPTRQLNGQTYKLIYPSDNKFSRYLEIEGNKTVQKYFDDLNFEEE